MAKRKSESANRQQGQVGAIEDLTQVRLHLYTTGGSMQD